MATPMDVGSIQKVGATCSQGEPSYVNMGTM